MIIKPMSLIEGGGLGTPRGCALLISDIVYIKEGKVLQVHNSLVAELDRLG